MLCKQELYQAIERLRLLRASAEKKVIICSPWTIPELKPHTIVQQLEHGNSKSFRETVLNVEVIAEKGQKKQDVPEQRRKKTLKSQ